MFNKKHVLFIILFICIILTPVSANDFNETQTLDTNHDNNNDISTSTDTYDTQNTITTEKQKQINSNDENKNHNKKSTNTNTEDTENTINSEQNKTKINSNNENQVLKDPKNITVNEKTSNGIQNAINDANDGDTLILDGTYPTSAFSGGYISINKKLNFIGINNAKLTGSTSSMYPGGINVQTTEVTFTNITFQNFNRGSQAIKISSGDVTFDKCTFNNNVRPIYVVDNGFCKVLNSKFIDCTSNNNGGAIYVETSCEIINCTFERSSAKDGAAIYMIGTSKSKIENCTFKDCSASGYGGAINCGIGSKTSFDDLTISNCKFINCHSDNQGGAISCDSPKNLNITNCYFESCYSNNMGGAIRLDTANNASIMNNTFKDCHGTNGIIHISNLRGNSYDVTIDKCNFENNYATKFGGAIDAYKTTNLKILNSNFTNCYTVNNMGGAIATDSCNNINISNCYFESCHSKEHGGAIRIDASTNSYIGNSTFINNYATGSGGAIHSAPYNSVTNSNITIDNCNFENNYANGNGGAIDIYQTPNINILNNNFTNCYTTNYMGGAISIFEGDNGNISNCYFDSCQSNTDGGAILLRGSTQINLNDSTFFNCSSQNGGSIYIGKHADGNKLKSSNITIDNCNFTNSSANNGGSISIDEESKSINIKNSNFKNSTSSEQNSVIQTSESNNININNCDIENCSGPYGAVAFLGTVNYINITDTQFSNCNSINGSAAIYWNKGTGLQLDGCEFENCTSKDESNPIKFGTETSNINILNCKFDKPIPDINYYYIPKLKVDDLQFIYDEEGILNVNLSNIYGPLINKDITLTILTCDNKPLTGNYVDTQKTDDEGIVRFQVNNLLHTAGTYLANVNFAGSTETYGENNATSKNITIKIYTYRAKLTVTQDGKYYNDTTLNFKLINSKNEPIQNAILILKLTNNDDINEETEYPIINGLFTFNFNYDPNKFKYNPGDYKFTAKIKNSDIDVNTIESNLTIYKINNGRIEITQKDNNLTFKTYNEDNGDILRNINIKLDFVNSENLHMYTNIRTNNEGIYSSPFPYEKGTYSVTATVTGDGNMQFKPSTLENFIINKDGPIKFIKANSKISFGSNAIIFDYLSTGSTSFAIVGGTILPENINIIEQPNIKPIIKDNQIIVSGLNVGTYTLKIGITADANHYSTEATIKIIVNPIYTTITAPNWSNYYKSGKTWTIKLTNTKTKNPLSNMKVNLKVYTGNKFKIITVTTNKKGEASLKPYTWKCGVHKVVLSFNKYGYNYKDLTRTIKVIKPLKLNYIIKHTAETDGSNIQIWVKKGKKPINKIKIKLLIYTGKKYKTLTLTTGNYKSHGKIKKGYICFGGNKLTTGQHKIIIKPASYKYTGTKTTKMTIKQSAKKVESYQIIVSNGKRKLQY